MSLIFKRTPGHFEKALLFCKKVGGHALFLLASNTLYSLLSILSLSINTSDSTSASRSEDVHVELEMKDRNVITLLLLASFLLCFPN